jgi:benzylsuccinate CoA-transferase BbsF subunit
VALSCWSDEEFSALCRAIAEPGLARNPDFATPAARRANVAELDRIIATWTQPQSADAAAETLQAAGVAAYPVVTVAGLFSDPQLAARRHWRVRRHPEIGDQAYCFPGFDLEEAPGDIVGPAPCLGGDNEFVFRELVGISEADMEAYRKCGVFG